MSGRGGLATFFLFLFLSITILLQVLSIVQSDRLYERLNHLNQALERAVPVGRAKVTPEDAVTSDDVHPGDDGDWLIWAFRVEPKTLNPISAETDVYTVWITIPYIFEPLLVYDYDPANGRMLKPHLAESYEVSSDGLEITFRLRNDIHFSDGTPVTTDDVVFTYETAGLRSRPNNAVFGSISPFFSARRCTLARQIAPKMSKQVLKTNLMRLFPFVVSARHPARANPAIAPRPPGDRRPGHPYRCPKSGCSCVSGA
ncbi:MAG: ABC transporter substrate-binding protein [Sedimentisphaerales bacterium]|nr:ABC transporter substrate-binding protein [Sedimentisphaerales bacterium]